MWVAVDLDDTLLHQDGSPMDGAAGAMGKLLEEGHRISIWTARFSKIKEEDKTKLRLQIEDELQLAGIPFSDVWVGPKPPADLFIGDNLVPFEGDWPKTLAQAHLMMKVRGTVNDVPEYEEIE